MSTTTSAQPAQLTRNERLDRLPFNKAHRKLLVASGIGWAFDAMDVGLVSFVVAAIAADPHFNLTPTEKSWVLSIGFVGMAIGAAVGGFIADRVGRKTVFTATLIIFGIANGAMALSWSLGMLLGARLIIGLGLGAELPVASTLVSEFSPTKQRGRMTVLLESFWAVGWIVAAMIGYFVIPNTGDWGWRWALAIGALPLLYAIVTRVHIPESVRFLEAKGREDEAEKAVRYFEEAGGVAPVTSPKGKPLPKIKTRELFGSKYLARTIAIWATWFFVNFSYYGAFTWMPSLLADQFGSLTKSFGYTLAISIAQLPGYFLAAWLVEVWGRRKTLSIFLAVSAVAAFAFSQAGSRGPRARVRHAAVRLQPRCVGRAVRRDPGNLPDPPAWRGRRCRRSGGPHRRHHRAAPHAVVPDPVRRQQGRGLHHLRRRLHHRLRRRPLPARTQRPRSRRLTEVDDGRTDICLITGRTPASRRKGRGGSAV